MEDPALTYDVGILYCKPSRRTMSGSYMFWNDRSIVRKNQSDIARRQRNGLTMKTQPRVSGLAFSILLHVALGCSFLAGRPSAARGAEVTLKGSMVCNGACIPDAKDDDHV